MEKKTNKAKLEILNFWENRLYFCMQNSYLSICDENSVKMQNSTVFMKTQK